MRYVIFGWTVILGAAPALALDASQLLLIYNADLPDSRELAGYYAEARGVPATQMVGVHVDPRAEEISAADYETRIRGPVRSFLVEHKLSQKVRCLVTFYGVSIRVTEVKPTPEQHKLRQDVEKQFLSVLDEIEKATARMDALANPRPVPAPARKPTEKDYGGILDRYRIVRGKAHERLTGEKSPKEVAEPFKAFIELIQECEGAGGLVEQLSSGSGDPNDEQNRKLEMVRQSVRAADQQIAQGLARGIADPNRGEVRTQIRQYYGLLGLVRALENDIQYLRTQETTAAVDSELALLWYPDYPRWRWIPNLLAWANRGNPNLARQLPPAFWQTPPMMVARLDASSPKVVRRMIDDAIATEKTGLVGRIYLDARGLYNQEPMSNWDASLRELATICRGAKLPVTLDNDKEVFKPGACPETALYCGWYSLRNYVDSFTFVPGAVAYHIASFEAISLRRPGERGWVKNLLDKGATVTMGPVAEPYLHAFPQPREFLGLLLTGRWTVAECYAFTSSLNSWMMMLVGDPLYSPFSASPKLAVEQVMDMKRVPPEFRTGAASQPASGPAWAPGSRSFTTTGAAGS